MAGVLALVSGAGCAPGEPPPPEATQVREWIELLYPLPKAERLSPPVASRVLAYSGVALYEALRHADTDAPGLDGRLRGLEGIPEPGPGVHDWGVAAAEAERRVITGLVSEWALPSTLVAIDTLAETQIERRMAAGISEEVAARSRDFGAAVAEAVLARAAVDGFRETRRLPYEVPKGQGLWVNTTTMEEYAPISVSEATAFVRRGNPSAALEAGSTNARQMLLDRPSPGQEPVGNINPTLALEPYWDRLLPWAMDTLEDCAPPPPAPYSMEAGSDFRTELMAVWETSLDLSEEERTIALFWADNPGATGTPPGHWVSIMRQMVTRADLDAVAAARMFALTSVAMADAFISSWHEKYRSNVIRPVTVIREHLDPAWETVVVTPPFPEYTSGHSVVSGAAAQVLEALLGAVAFHDSTHIAVGLAPRPYASFHEAAEEAAVSRLYGGIHYPMGIDHGLDQGRCLADRVLARSNTPGAHAQ